MDFITPVGRLVQGSTAMQHQKDVDTNQPLYENGQPVMGTFLALAFPKVLPNGQPNTEFDQFFAQLKQVAATAWPQLFPQGPHGACVNPMFSWKYQDGDGVTLRGQSVSEKPGFKGHHIVRFFTSYPLRCFNEGKFLPHEEIQKPEEVIKRGFWVRVFGEAKSNNATGNQVPGIGLYPKLLSFVERGEEIASGPDAQQAFGTAAVGWRPPPSASPIPGPAAVAVPSVAVPGAPGVPAAPVVAPVLPVPPTGPQVSPALVAQGVTWDALKAAGWTEEAARAHGHLV